MCVKQYTGGGGGDVWNFNILVIRHRKLPIKKQNKKEAPMEDAFQKCTY